MADTLQIIADGRHEPFDRANWQGHWRTASVVEGLLGMSIVLAGAGLLRRRLRGLLTWCIGVSIVPAWMVAMRMFGVYPFEEASLAGSMTVAFLCLASWVALWRNGRRH